MFYLLTYLLTMDSEIHVANSSYVTA